MINLMTNEAGMVAGNRSDEDSNDEVPFDLPTKDCFDRAIFLPNTSSSKKLAAQKKCRPTPNTLEIQDYPCNDDHTMDVQLLEWQ